MAKTSKSPKPVAREVIVSLDAADATYAKHFVRVDDTRCLAIGNRSARWLEGSEPGALVDLGGGYYGHSKPYVLPDGRVVLAGLDSLVVLDRTSASAHAYTFEAPLHVLPSGLSAGGLLLVGVTDAVAVWVDLEGRQRALVDARERGCVVAGGSAAYVLRTDDGVLHMERHDGTTKTTAALPWEGVETDSTRYRGVGVTGAVARGDRLVATHHDLAVVAHWRGDTARRITTASRIVDARLDATHTFLRDAANPPTLLVLDAAGETRWQASTARYTSLRVAGERVLSVSRKGEDLQLFALHSGVEEFRGALALARADDLFEGAVVGITSGVVLGPRRHGEPQKNAWLVVPGRDPQKIPHAGLGGAVAWGPAGFATWGDAREAGVSVKIWTV